MKEISFKQRIDGGKVVDNLYEIQITFETPIRGFSGIIVSVLDQDDAYLKVSPYIVSLVEFKTRDDMIKYFIDKKDKKWTYNLKDCINHYDFHLKSAQEVSYFLNMFGYEVSLESIREMSKKFEQPYIDKVKKYWK